jgi:hypothetical protein
VLKGTGFSPYIHSSNKRKSTRAAKPRPGHSLPQPATIQPPIRGSRGLPLLAEEFIRAVGRGFIPGIKAESNWALPLRYVFRPFKPNLDFFRSLFSRAALQSFFKEINPLNKAAPHPLHPANEAQSSFRPFRLLADSLSGPTPVPATNQLSTTKPSRCPSQRFSLQVRILVTSASMRTSKKA